MAPHTKQNCTLMDPSFAQGRQVFTDRWVVISGRSGEGARLEDNSPASSPLPGRRRSYAGRARRRACERRAAAAGWHVPAEPTMPRLNSQVLEF